MPNQAAEKIAEILRRHFFIASWDGEGCGCNSWRGPLFDWYEHLSEVLVSELGLTREWSNAYEKAGNGWVWRNERTGAFSNRGVAEANMRLQEINPVDFMRNMRIESRYVTEWSDE